MRRILSNNRWAILLGLLMTSMVLEAILAQSVGRNLLLDFAVLVVGVSIMVGLVFAVEHPPIIDYLGLLLLAAYGVFGVINLVTDNEVVDRVLLSLSSLLLCAGLVITFLQLIRPVKSDREKLFSAVFGYFLIALLWAYLYWRIDMVMPGALNFPEGGDYGGATYLYYSLVTMSTLGYGEITPALPVPRILAALQASFGTLYVAVLIGQIVGRFR